MISIIILNYFNESKTIKALNSLKNQLDGEFICLIDNGSNNSSLEEYLKLNFTNYLYIKPESNLGFGGGVNLGIKKSIDKGYQWFFLLNNDVICPEDLLANIRSNLNGDLIGLPIKEDGGIARAGVVKYLKHTLDHVYKDIKDEQDYYAIGGAMIINKSVIDKIGLLDDKYFMYFEDADFSIRATRAGFKIVFPNIPAIEHEVLGTSKDLGSPMLLRIHYRNAFYFNNKLGSPSIKLLNYIWSGFVFIKQIIKISIGFRVDRSRAILRGVLDFYLNRMGRIW